ncbi:ATP-grasp domain-containing protein [Butyrivibrio sp. MC2013]|uniref:ATP-grasp domain-containing protein n=1 Tax=Butyrivibrio sp. MC2013 TaxID=1280686 RepID=UPI0003FC4454|nr:ATP-grasp domain-containing protein [Butyrivibrio sp. MC2013]
MAKIMVVAGGDWQIELIKKCKEMGHYVICSNLYEVSPAFPYADACEVCNVLDKEGNLEIARKYMPDAVISDQSDIAVPTVAYVSEKMGLRGIGTKLADLFTNKGIMRQFAHDNGINIPEYKVCKTPEDAMELLDDFGRIIIKPLDSQSSRGVFTITSREELEEHYEETISFSNREKVFLAEEYIDGDEFTIDGLVVNGHHYPLCISVKEMYKENMNISKTQTYTYAGMGHDYDKLRAANRELIMKAGLPFGLTHSEYRSHNGRYYLIEAGARGGGSNLSAKIVPFMSGVDNYEYYIKSVLGEPVDETPLKNLVLPRDRAVIMRFFDFGEGIVRSMEGRDYLINSPNLIDYQLEVKAGDKLENPRYGRLRPGHFIIGSDDYASLKEEAAEIVKNVHPVFE